MCKPGLPEIESSTSLKLTYPPVLVQMSNPFKQQNVLLRKQAALTLVLIFLQCFHPLISEVSEDNKLI